MIINNILIFIVCLCILESKALLAQSIESIVGMATDIEEHHLFTENPALADPTKFSFGFLGIQKNIKVKATLISNDAPAKTQTKVATSDQAVGLLLPIGGGAAAGINGQTLTQTERSTIDQSSASVEEKFRKQHFNARLILKVVDKVRAAFALRYASLDHTVSGAYFRDPSADINYKGKLIGFAIGLQYGDGPLLFGASYTAPMQGKVSVHGDRLIAGESGFMTINLGYGEIKDWHWAFAAKRWLHKSDDRSKEYVVPESDDAVSLNGVNVERFLFPVIRYSLGVDTPYVGDTFLRFSLTQTEYVFLFEHGSIPGDDPDQETEVKALHAQTSVVYNPSDFAIHAGYFYEQRKKHTVDTVYTNYHAVEKTLFVAFSYKR